jgi:hypothetical protein
VLCGISSSELAGCVHRPIVDFKSTIAKPNLSQLYLSRLSLAKAAKLNFFKTPASVYPYDAMLADTFFLFSVFRSYDFNPAEPFEQNSELYVGEGLRRRFCHSVLFEELP